jgi:hypothetical protein
MPRSGAFAGVGRATPSAGVPFRGLRGTVTLLLTVEEPAVGCRHTH